jgi:hypothetical protein
MEDDNLNTEQDIDDKEDNDDDENEPRNIDNLQDGDEDFTDEEWKEVE